MIVELAHKLTALSNNYVGIIFKTKRTGEIIRNYSGIERASRSLEFVPQMDLDTGLEMTYEWFCKKWKIMAVLLMVICLCATVRISFAGGWTDFDFQDQPIAVVNIAMNSYSYVTAKIE